MRQRFLSHLKQLSDGNRGTCPELNPDVIVILMDNTVIFETRNQRASALLRQKCGWDTETIHRSERIHVHPAETGRLIEALTAAGLIVSD